MRLSKMRLPHSAAITGSAFSASMPASRSAVRASPDIPLYRLSGRAGAVKSLRHRADWEQERLHLHVRILVAVKVGHDPGVFLPAERADELDLASRRVGHLEDAGIDREELGLAGTEGDRRV